MDLEEGGEELDFGAHFNWILRVATIAVQAGSWKDTQLSDNAPHSSPAAPSLLFQSFPLPPSSDKTL